MAKHHISEYLRILPQGGLCDYIYYWQNLDLSYEEAQIVTKSNKDHVIVRTAFGVKKHMYAHGNTLLFDTKAERDTYREAYYAEHDERTRRNKMIQALVKEFKSSLETKSTAKLEEYMAKVFK